ncbi:hypothetical protein [Parachlamydia sp. AcF125]|uniref:hypothetical protein n=1 Tax=Parachlamydia sp. AcF125 TaxID=2795736 RepID=UPI001BD813B2|nr:hypothetical protein [Parachlamydia sp. AcF125]MBS4168581.1 hypothetical protein [Parachlamydia sp. AcF125]
MINLPQQMPPFYLTTAASVLAEPEIPEEFIQKGELKAHDLSLIKESVIAAKKRVFEKIVKKLSTRGAVNTCDDPAEFNRKVADDPAFRQKVSQRHSHQLRYEFNKVAEKVEELRPGINWRKKEGETFPTWLGINHVTKREVSLWNSRGPNLHGVACIPDSGEKAYKKALRAEIAQASQIEREE